MSASNSRTCGLVLTREIPFCQDHVELLVTIKLGYKVPD